MSLYGLCYPSGKSPSGASYHPGSGKGCLVRKVANGEGTTRVHVLLFNQFSPMQTETGPIFSRLY